MTIARGSTHLMAYEFTCDSGDGLKTGYILNDKGMMKQGGGKDIDRAMEIYFQKNTSTSAGHVDLLQVASGNDSSSEHLGVQFSTTDGDSFKLYVIRTTTNGGDSFGLWGVKSTQKVLLNSIHKTAAGFATDTTAIDSPSGSGTFSECLDFSGDSAVAGTGCEAATAAATGTKFNDAALSAWTISAIASAAVTTSF